MSTLLFLFFLLFLATIAAGILAALCLFASRSVRQPKQFPDYLYAPPRNISPSVAGLASSFSWFKGNPESLEATKLWHRLLWRLESDLPSSWASSCPTPPDLEDAFKLLYKAKRLMKGLA
jgi:hypothetical protein